MAFKDIIGHETPIKTIKNILLKGEQAGGTYLFLGPDGIGKRTTGIEFAKAVNCEHSSEEGLCDCVSCRKISSGNHPDVFIICPKAPSDSIGIDEIRNIRYEASLKPYEGMKRVFIINDAEKMTEEAQNAFLKLLEEPPQNHIFILTSSNVGGLLPTVLSRCKVLKFTSLGESEIRQFLLGHNFDEKDIELFSHMAMGSIGRAVKFKEKNIISQRDRALNNFFFRKSALFRESILNEEASGDIEETLYMLLCWYRDLLVSKFTRERCGLLNIDRAEEIFSYSERFSEPRLEKGLLDIMKTIGHVRKNINPKIALFNMALELKRS